MSRITIKIQRDVKTQIEELKEELRFEITPSVSEVIKYLIEKFKENSDEQN